MSFVTLIQPFSYEISELNIYKKLISLIKSQYFRVKEIG